MFLRRTLLVQIFSNREVKWMAMKCSTFRLLVFLQIPAPRYPVRVPNFISQIFKALCLVNRPILLSAVTFKYCNKNESLDFQVTMKPLCVKSLC